MDNRLTIGELKAYQAGQLEGPALHRVERLLLEDPFYADALEGLEALQHTGASLPRQTAQLRRALHRRIRESASERRLFPLWVTTMVVSILLMIGIALYFIYKRPIAGGDSAPSATPPDSGVVKKASPGSLPADSSRLQQTPRRPTP